MAALYNLGRTVTAAMAGVLLTACASPVPESQTCNALHVATSDPPQITQGPSMSREEAQVFAMGSMFAERAPPPEAPRRVINVALLSAGGQWGAFTAGFMNGWSANQTSPRPQTFDVVTGVSTGALLAPFVFSGSDRDHVLRDLFYGVRESDILRRRGTLELTGAPSLWDPLPLQNLTERHLTPDLIADIAAAGATRTLLVGSVNMRTGSFEAFDLTAQAKAPPAMARPCLREALLASSAIPVAFPPRHINNDFYVDGAARQGLFLRGLAAGQVRPRIYVFVNNPVDFPVEKTAYSLPRLAGRTSTILSDALLRSSVLDAVQFARRQGWEVRGIFAPDLVPGSDCTVGEGTKLSFCESFTKRLFEEGEMLGRAEPIPWLDADALLDRLSKRR